jgi:hypothetical protein
MHPVKVNGFVCKDSMAVNADDFFKAEILTVLEGTLYVGFVTSNQADRRNKLFAKVLNKGDVFVFPQGLIHFQFNPVHDKPAVALTALSSQNPRAITIANAVFGSKPPISDDVLAKAFTSAKWDN